VLTKLYNENIGGHHYTFTIRHPGLLSLSPPSVDRLE